MNVSEALATRISCRAFKPDPVNSETVRAIIDGARFAPSGGNLQPWSLFAVSGAPLARIFDDVYPPDLKEPYAARRFKCGEDLYASIGIDRYDKPGRIRQFRRNFEMFGAPVGLFVYIDRTMGPPQWSDVGMFLQSVMLLAREHGLHTCAQEAWVQWHTTIDEHLKPPADWMLFCGIAVGYMDEDHPINTLRTERAPVDEIVTFLG
ncbi:nitroreductase [Hoeflea sp. CAU 1731]